MAGRNTPASVNVAFSNQISRKADINSMPASTLVFGFCVIRFNILAPLVNGVAYCKAER
jgi:hypothetical protein